MPNTSKASPATDSRRNTQCNDVTHNARREERLRLWAFSRTQKLGNGQRPCWVHELTSLSIRALRVFAEQKRRHGFLPLTSLAEISFLRIPKMHLNMMYNLKSAKLILSCTVDRLFRATATFLRLKVLG